MKDYKCALCANCNEIKYDGFFCDKTGYVECKLAEDECPDFEADAEPIRHGRWIPCSERLPEIDKDVIVYYPYWKDNPIQVAHLQYDELYFELSDGEFNLPVKAVTHWMPLPDAPKERSEEQ